MCSITKLLKLLLYFTFFLTFLFYFVGSTYLSWNDSDIWKYFNFTSQNFSAAEIETYRSVHGNAWFCVFLIGVFLLAFSTFFFVTSSEETTDRWIKSVHYYLLYLVCESFTYLTIWILVSLSNEYNPDIFIGALFHFPVISYMAFNTISHIILIRQTILGEKHEESIVLTYARAVFILTVLVLHFVLLPYGFFSYLDTCFGTFMLQGLVIMPIGRTCLDWLPIVYSDEVIANRKLIFVSYHLSWIMLHCILWLMLLLPFAKLLHICLLALWIDNPSDVNMAFSVPCTSRLLIILGWTTVFCIGRDICLISNFSFYSSEVVGYHSINHEINIQISFNNFSCRVRNLEPKSGAKIIINNRVFVPGWSKYRPEYEKKKEIYFEESEPKNTQSV